MIHFSKPRFKLYKREGIDLFLKNKKFPNKKITDLKNSKIDISSTHFSIQLKEKQKVKIIYGVLEKQFSKYYFISKKMGGDLSWNIVCMLESRLDNVVYRMGLACTRSESKQIISHGCILVNNKPVNISSYLLNLGDIVKLKPKCFKQKRIIDSLNYLKLINIHSYLLFFFK